jgi:hypothetical protein
MQQLARRFLPLSEEPMPEMEKFTFPQEDAEDYAQAHGVPASDDASPFSTPDSGGSATPDSQQAAADAYRYMGDVRDSHGANPYDRGTVDGSEGNPPYCYVNEGDEYDYEAAYNSAAANRDDQDPQLLDGNHDHEVRELVHGNEDDADKRREPPPEEPYHPPAIPEVPEISWVL